MSLSYRNQSIDLRCKSIDWFLYDNGLRHKRVKRVRLFIYQTMCLKNHLLRKKVSYVIFNKFKQLSLYKSDEVQIYHQKVIKRIFQWNVLALWINGKRFSKTRNQQEVGFLFNKNLQSYREQFLLTAFHRVQSNSKEAFYLSW